MRYDDAWVGQAQYRSTSARAVSRDSDALVDMKSTASSIVISPEVQGGVDDDAGGAEQPEVALAELLLGRGEEPLLPQQVLGVQPPALDEVGRAEDEAQRPGRRPWEDSQARCQW